MKQDGAYWIEKLELKAHVEGGFYREIYRSPLTVARTALPSRFKGDRSFLTSIYFLLLQGQFSAFHRIASDETWHFYAGDCLVIYEIRPAGTMVEHRLGNHADQGELFQVTIQAGNWFAARIPEAGAFALTGCTVSPGFDFADFELAGASRLIREFPQHRTLIESLTRGG